MKKKTWIAGTLAGLLIATGCHAGWLHQAYQGEFCAHDHKYVVSNEGAISIQTKEYATPTYLTTMNLEKTWTTDLSFSDLTDLDNVISDLQRISKEMHQKQGNDSGCKPGCGD